jgi:hypothetical protein
MGTVCLHGLRVRRLERALRERGVKDVKLVATPSAHVSRDAMTESICTVLEAYLTGKTTPMSCAGL